MSNQIFIIAEQAIGNTDNSDATLAQLEQLTDSFIDLVCVPDALQPVYRLLGFIGSFLPPKMETCGTFRLVRFDEDGCEVDIGEPDQVVGT